MKTKLLSILNYQNSRIARYIMRNLVILFFAIMFIIGLVLFGNQFVLTVQESIEAWDGTRRDLSNNFDIDVLTAKPNYP